MPMGAVGGGGAGIGASSLTETGTPSCITKPSGNSSEYPTPGAIMSATFSPPAIDCAYCKPELNSGSTIFLAISIPLSLY